MRSRLSRLRPHQWLVLAEAVVLLPLVRISLSRRGFARTADELARRSKGPVRPYGPDAVDRVVEAVTVAAARPLVGSTCLPRALVAWFLLRRRGVDADLRIGAASPTELELAAHAWVDVYGRPVREAVDVATRFPVLPLALPKLEDQ